jgi:hypothetical protein
MKTEYNKIKILKLRPAGMLSNVNEVIHHLHLAELGNYKFKIDWSNSSYKSEDRPGDPWSYYFEDCFHLDDIKIAGLPVVDETAYNETNIVTPYVDDVLQMPSNRELASSYIKKYIRLKPEIKRRVEAFVAKHNSDQVIGLHIRGPLRTDAGGAIRSKLKMKKGVPFDLYFNPVKERLKQFPEAKVLICSDSQMVIDETCAEFGDRVISYEAIRSEKGEMHIRNGMMLNATFDPYALGEDMLVECDLLALSSFFVHGYSNVANYVLCKSPNLESHYSYAGLTDAKLSGVSISKAKFQAKAFGQRVYGAIGRRLARPGSK